MPKTFYPGDELRDDDGALLLTFARTYTATTAGAVPSPEDVLLPDGNHPLAGTEIDRRACQLLEALSRG